MLVRKLRDEHGSVLIEAALALPVMISLIIGGFDISMGMIYAQQVQFMAQLGAMCASQGAQQCPDAGTTQRYLANSANLPGITTGNFHVLWPPGASCGLLVTATYPYTPMVLPKITLSSTECMPCAKGVC